MQCSSFQVGATTGWPSKSARKLAQMHRTPLVPARIDEPSTRRGYGDGHGVEDPVITDRRKKSVNTALLSIGNGQALGLAGTDRRMMRCSTFRWNNRPDRPPLIKALFVPSQRMASDAARLRRRARAVLVTGGRKSQTTRRILSFRGDQADQTVRHEPRRIMRSPRRGGKRTRCG
jgi:hypothetical protein